MIKTSEKFQELMKSNIRPKCEPVITISGVDNNGNETTLTWKAKDIKSLTYKRGIDPVGRELPYMELTWTEIYKGKLNAENYPEKYNNIVKYMEVELSFVQYLGFFNSWKLLFESGATWKELFSGNTTWNGLKSTVGTETITMPKMYLAARPTVEGTTITWTATDLISFLDEKQTKSFLIDGYLGTELYTIPFENPLIYILTDARSNFLNSPKLFRALTDTISNLSSTSVADDLDKVIIFENSAKNNILNYANIANKYWDFKDNICYLDYIPFSGPKTTQYFSKKIMTKYPTVTQGTNISAYNFKNHLAVFEQSRQYEKECVAKTFDNATIYVCQFNECGRAINGTFLVSEVNQAVSGVNEKLNIVPLYYNSYDNVLNNTVVGEVYSEDNPIYPFSSSDEKAKERFNVLTSYFNKDCASLEFECLPYLSVETGDIVGVDTNLYDSGGNQITKNALIVSMEITYNGALKEKIKAHEVKV